MISIEIVQMMNFLIKKEKLDLPLVRFVCALKLIKNDCKRLYEVKTIAHIISERLYKIDVLCAYCII